MFSAVCAVTRQTITLDMCMMSGQQPNILPALNKYEFGKVQLNGAQTASQWTA